MPVKPPDHLHGIGINASYFVIENNEVAFNGFDPPEFVYID